MHSPLIPDTTDDPPALLVLHTSDELATLYVDRGNWDFQLVVKHGARKGTWEEALELVQQEGFEVMPAEECEADLLDDGVRLWLAEAVPVAA